MNTQDFLTELHLAVATTNLPLPALVRGIDPSREDLARDLASGRAPQEVFEAHALIPAAAEGNESHGPPSLPRPFPQVLAQAAIRGQDKSYTLRLIGGPLVILLICSGSLALVVWFYLSQIGTVFSNLLGENAEGFGGMWQVYVGLGLLLLFCVGCLLMGVVLLVKLFSVRASDSWFLSRLLPSADRVDRLDRPSTANRTIRFSRAQRARQLHYSAESNGGEWMEFIPIFVLWVAPTIALSIFLPIIRLVTSLGG